MENGILSGNASEAGENNRNWIVGHFQTMPTLQSKDVEIKWDALKKGNKNESFAAQAKGTTISILIRGNMKYRFREPVGNKVTGYDDECRVEFKETCEWLNKEGDFLIWEPLVYHYWEAVEDSLVVTVRWPSQKDDVFRMAMEPFG